MNTILDGLVDRDFIPVSSMTLQSPRLQSCAPMACDCDGDCGQGDCDCPSGPDSGDYDDD